MSSAAAALASSGVSFFLGALCRGGGMLRGCLLGWQPYACASCLHARSLQQATLRNPCWASHRLCTRCRPAPVPAGMAPSTAYLGHQERLIQVGISLQHSQNSTSAVGRYTVRSRISLPVQPSFRCRKGCPSCAPLPPHSNRPAHLVLLQPPNGCLQAATPAVVQSARGTGSREALLGMAWHGMAGS